MTKKIQPATKFAIGQEVDMPGTRDAVIVGIVKLARGKKLTMYQIEYTIDDEIERRAEKVRGVRRHTQPRYENEISGK